MLCTCFNSFLLVRFPSSSSSFFLFVLSLKCVKVIEASTFFFTNQHSKEIFHCIRTYNEQKMSFSSTSTPSPSITSNPFLGLLRKQSSTSTTLGRDVPYVRQSRASIDAILSRTLPPLQETIGFSTLPDQIHRKTMKRGFEFTLMVVGRWI